MIFRENRKMQLCECGCGQEVTKEGMEKKSETN